MGSSRLVWVSAALATAAMLAVFAIGAIAQRQWTDATDENCARIHRIVVVGSSIITAGRASTYRYWREGLLSRRQRDDALRRIDAQLRLWRSADCIPH